MTYMILFDGECLFCQHSVQFIIKRDPKKKFKFLSLQSSTGKRLLHEHGMPQSVTSLVLIKEDKIYIKSSAALQICKHLKGIWKIGYLFLGLPKPIRDCIYNFIAKHRYQLVGKTTSCPIPSSEVRERLL